VGPTFVVGCDRSLTSRMCRFPLHLTRDKSQRTSGNNQRSQEQILLKDGFIFRDYAKTKVSREDVVSSFKNQNIYMNGLKFLGRHNKRSYVEDRRFKSPVQTKKQKNVARAKRHMQPPEKPPDEDVLLDGGTESPLFARQVLLGQEQKIMGQAFPSNYLPFIPKLGPDQFVGIDDEPLTANNFFLENGEFAGILLCPSSISLNDCWKDKLVYENVPAKDYRSSRAYIKILLPYDDSWDKGTTYRKRRKIIDIAHKGRKARLVRLFQYELCLELLYSKGPRMRDLDTRKTYYVEKHPHEWEY